MASGHGVDKPNTAGHPGRQVGRHKYVDKYGNPVSSPLQAYNYVPPGGGGSSDPSLDQINAFETNPVAQALDDRNRDADMDLRDRYRED